MTFPGIRITAALTQRNSRQILAALSFSVLAYTPPASAQLPQINQGGVVNAASWSSPVVPGSIVAIFGANLASVRQSANAPWPLTLGGTSVTINGVPAPLAFVSPEQINAYVPSSVLAPDSRNISAVSVIVTTSAGSGSAYAPLAAGSPGLFSADGSGCGQAAALNITPGGAVSLNSASNSAAPGDYIALFGTGFGLAAPQPPDGVAASGISPLQSAPQLFLDKAPVSSLLYAGLAPSLAGVDQINFQIPSSTRNGCAVAVSAAQTLGSPSLTISVQQGRGQCANPPVQSWGRLSLSKAIFSGPEPVPVPALESFSASFPSGPEVQPPNPESIVYAPNWVAAAPVGISRSALPVNMRTCAVPGYSNLSAGTIQLQPPSGDAVMVQPQPVQAGGVVYTQSLPAGFVGPGPYTISGTPGSAIGLTAKLIVGSPIQLQTSFPPGTVVSSSQPLTIKWTGGDPGTLVRVSLSADDGAFTSSDNSYASAASGSLTMLPACSPNPASAEKDVVCTFGLPLSSNARISVGVLPAPNQIPSVRVPGVTGPVQLTWQYTYNFSGLILGP